VSNRTDDESWASLVKIPADVDKDDTVLGPLTARQALQIGAVLIVLWVAYHASKPFVPPLVFVGAALPVGAAAALAVLSRHDGLSLERWLFAAWRHHRAPRHLTPHDVAAEALPWQAEVAERGFGPVRIGRLKLPVADVDERGLLDLGPAGASALSEAGTVNFTLRTGGEQRALVTAFGRWLNALSGPTQILVRTRQFDAGPLVTRMRQTAPALPHPLLEQACLDHADFLATLCAQNELLERRVLVALREPGLDAGAPARVLRRRDESGGLLAAAEIVVRPLSGPAAFAALSAACDPDAPQHPEPALPHVPVTAMTTIGEPS
jgi:hypothetical protein